MVVVVMMISGKFMRRQDGGHAQLTGNDKDKKQELVNPYSNQHLRTLQ